MSTSQIRVALYARVSTAEQSADLQLHALRALAATRGWAVQGEYLDHAVSGSRERRPRLDALMTSVHRGEIDVVAVWKFDRFARSLRHLVTALEDFQARGVTFHSLQDGIDTSTSTGRLMFGVIASFAQFERDIIRERTIAGLASARRKGVRLGRPRVRVDLARALTLQAGGASMRRIASDLGIGLGTLQRELTAHRASACTSNPLAVSEVTTRKVTLLPTP